MKPGDGPNRATEFSVWTVPVFLVPVFLLCLGVSSASADQRTHSVRVEKRSVGWRLLVDDQPFFIKGVGCNRARGGNGEDWLLMAKEMGANAVRTWGGAERSYLDKAQAYGLKVNLGFWLNPIHGAMTESYQDPEHRRRVKDEILDYVHSMKDHPALLLWNIGNEALHFTEKEEECHALGTFLEELIQAVHQEDPRHPVVYAAASTKDLTYLKTHVPGLDIAGVNTYGGLSTMLGWLRANSYEKPVVVTEFGPVGAWDMNKDKNGSPYDPFDHFKAANYASLWRQIEAEKSTCLGGFAFVLGEQRHQDSLTWWNLNWKDHRRQAYWALYELYTGKKPHNRPPQFSRFTLEGSSGVRPGERIALQTEARDPEGDPVHYEYVITDIADHPFLVIPPRFYPAEAEENSPGVAQVRVPNEPGIYRVYAVALDTHKNAAVANRSIRVEGH